MSEKVSDDGEQLPRTTTREIIPFEDVKDDEHDQRQLPDALPASISLVRHQQEANNFVDSGDADREGNFSAPGEDDLRKMSQDSLISDGLCDSPMLHPTRHHRRFIDSDSCPSVSPSPDPDTQLRTFDFSNIEVSDEGESISAALQTEKEFLDFMLSLPQIQKDVPGRTFPPQKDTSGQPLQESDPQLFSDQRPPPPNIGGVVGTKMGLDHLDNLCRMMEQLGELKEQNTRLQRRVHYLEELQTLQEMHRHLQETLEARRSGLGLAPIDLSDSELRLDLDGNGEGVAGGELSQHGSEESLLLLERHHTPHKGKPRQPFFTLERSRSKSVGPMLMEGCAHRNPKTKVSGWKRVKEALKWERATFLPPAPTPATATSAHHPNSPPTNPSPLEPISSSEGPYFRPPSSSSSSSAMTQVMTEEDLLNLCRQDFDQNQFLEPPESPCRRHSSSEDDRRVATLEREERARSHDKEKKGHRSAWGKVKNMISTRRDSVRKKSFASSHRKSTCDRPCHEASGMGIAVEVSAASDPEDYDVDYEGVTSDVLDPTGGMEGQDMDWETTGNVWIGPEQTQITSTNLGVRRSKPQLTITVPSSENLSLLQEAGKRSRSASQKSPEPTRRKVSPLQMELRTSPSLPMTPPSPRRSSNWTKVKKAFLTSQHHLQQHHGKSDGLFSITGGSSSLPPSPSKKNSFQFEAPHLLVESQLDDSDSPCPSLEVSPDVLLPPGGTPHSTPSPQPQPSPVPHGQQQGVHMNIADLQKSLSGEFNRRLQEWERLKGGSGPAVPLHSPLAFTVSGPTAVGPNSQPEDNLPQEFRKKLHEWEKMKEREREKIKVDMSRGQEDVKTKIHGEDDLPADFKKKLTEWKIRKALVGKSQQNVEELQKNLGEEFNRKMAEWERIKASANQGHSQVKTSASVSSIQVGSTSQVKTATGPCHGHSIKQSASAGQVLVKPQSPGPESSSPRLDRKGSGQKIKKMKSSKTDKVPLAKTEGGHKGRYKTDKELLWLEKELHKVERETQRLEREKEKFLERQARLEKMRQAMGQGPATKKEIYIKTSTGEFRFEGISQTFTKKLYEWEERRGIRPESSTIALLDPNYKAPEKEVQEKPRSPELMRLGRSKSESSVAADLVVTSGNSHPSSLSLNEMDQEDSGTLQAENKAASEPTLGGEECSAPKVAVLVQLEEVVEEGGHPSAHYPTTPYAPAEITRNIDSSGSEEDVTRRKRADDDEDYASHLRHVDSSSRTPGSYRTLLQENMSLLDKLRQKEDLCRALEHQMGDIDFKMDNVADQHLKTLEKLHRQVTIIMKDTGSSATGEGEGEGGDDDLANVNDDPEANQRLINHLRARISELEARGDHLKDEKEQLEMAFKLHKEQETEIAESLVMRIRELQDAGAEVNIQTVQCQTDDLPNTNQASATETSHEEVHEESHDNPVKVEVFPEKKDMASGRIEEPVAKKDHRQREHRKMKKAPPKKVQRLHNLTGDLLFQAKRMEQALVSKHGLDRRGEQQKGIGYNNGHRQRSLRGRSSLRLTGDSGSSQRRREASARTWSSIEAITVPNESPPNGSSAWENRSSGALERSYATSDGLEASSRSLRNPSSVHSSDQQDILAMNAELSRMAKELRMELMKMWSFRESTSPESETSDSIDRRGVDGAKTHTEPDRLLAEANEVFQSIALLQKDSSSPTPQSVRSSTTRLRRSPSITSISKHREADEFEDKVIRGSVDRDRSQSASGTPSQRDPYSQQRQQYEDDEDEDEPRNVDKDRSTFLPTGSSLDQLLLRTQLEEDDRVWETARRSSDGLSTVTSGPSRSHSPSPSIASSAPEAETSPRLDDEDDGLSLTGTWKTATNSTLRSGEHVLSSSFEWDEEESDERRRKRENWNMAVEEDIQELQEPKAKSLRKYGPNSEFHKSFETEVTTSNPRATTRDLKTRRISDTQVEYDTRGENNKDECFAYTFSRTVYDDEALTAGKQGNLRDPDDTHHRCLKSIPTAITSHSMPSDKSPDIFVPTKRTIFTVQGGVLNSEQARATPTFVDNQDELSLSIQKKETLMSTDAKGDLPVKKQKCFRKDLKKDHCFVQNSSQALVKVSGESVNQSDDTLEKTSTDYPKDKKDSKDSKSVQGQLDSQPKVEKMESTESHLLEINIKKDSETLCERKDSEKKDSDNLPMENIDEISQEVLENEAMNVSPIKLGDQIPCFSKPLKPVQPINTPMVTMLFQKSPPTSPPIESKRKVLEAANEGIPTVKNIIQKFNQRITENQELLGSPFRSPPSSPPHQSPRSQRKLLSEITGASWKNSPVHQQGTPVSVTNSSGGVLKSLSTSVIINTETPQLVHRSASSSLVQNKCPITVNPVTSSAMTSTPFGMASNDPNLSDAWKNSQIITPVGTSVISSVSSPTCTPTVSHTPTDVDTSYDLDVSVDDHMLVVQNQLGNSSSSVDKSPSGKLRAMKLKRAKEEFLSRGAALHVLDHRLSADQDSIKLRQRSGTASTDDSWRDSGEISPCSPSPLPQLSPSEKIIINRENMPDESPKIIPKRNKAAKKESFRRQSAHSLLEQSPLKQSTQVSKSASSGTLESPNRVCGQPADSESRGSRKDSIEPPTDSGKSSSRGFFKLFRRHRNRDKKDMPSVQRLCRQSLLVDFPSGRMRTQSASPQPMGESHLLALQEVDAEESQDVPRSSKTLPRGTSGEAVHPTPSRSCPSSPVAPHRSRAANWLVRGRQIFESRSPSPNKKQR
ncbi:microtubule-associated protein futsch-like isoform X2 [Palaemon carinicauda]|uniref:microtubule-associated protein futsch-like isoform X2 n=1 Tax=Palaemon carinicauda TaxID=392227 RepID=UPI0035B66DDA